MYLISIMIYMTSQILSWKANLLNSMSYEFEIII